MKYICAQPQTLYYRWQVDTMINSFIQNNVNQCDIIILSNQETKEFDVLIKKYPEVNFLSYKVPIQKYQPAIKPYLMYLYFQEHQNEEQYFYHDCDIVLTKPLPEFESGIFMSNTVSYIGYKYIESKGQEVVDIVCKTVGLEESVLIERQENSGGCQFVFQTLPAKVWQKAYEDSYRLWENITAYNIENAYKYKDTFPLQVWTAEMWATLYSMWYYGYYGKVDNRLNFAWSTDNASRIQDVAILHNAGVTEQPNLFKKFNYMKKLPSCDLHIDESRCSNYYYKKVKEVICNN